MLISVHIVLHIILNFILFDFVCLQFVFGFFSFLILLCCEGATAAFRASMVPIHASFGLTTFMLAIATCLTGLTEKAIFTLGYVTSIETYFSYTTGRKLLYSLRYCNIEFIYSYLFTYRPLIKGNNYLIF